MDEHVVLCLICVIKGKFKTNTCKHLIYILDMGANVDDKSG